jgi:hypothetical protein
MLRVHRPDLARRHAEERCVEARHVVDEARSAGHDLAGRTGHRVEEFVDIPAVRRYLRHRVPALNQEVPELVGARGAREARRVSDDGETGGRLGRTCGGCHAVVLLASAVSDFWEFLRANNADETIARQAVVREASGSGPTGAGRLQQ